MRWRSSGRPTWRRKEKKRKKLNKFSLGLRPLCHPIQCPDRACRIWTYRLALSRDEPSRSKQGRGGGGGRRGSRGSAADRRRLPTTLLGALLRRRRHRPCPRGARRCCGGRHPGRYRGAARGEAQHRKTSWTGGGAVGKGRSKKEREPVAKKSATFFFFFFFFFSRQNSKLDQLSGQRASEEREEKRISLRSRFLIRSETSGERSEIETHLQTHKHTQRGKEMTAKTSERASGSSFHAGKQGSVDFFSLVLARRVLPSLTPSLSPLLFF